MNYKFYKQLSNNINVKYLLPSLSNAILVTGKRWVCKVLYL